MTIEIILEESRVGLYGEVSDAMDRARARAAISKRIAAIYPAFEGLRDYLLDRRGFRLTPVHKPLLFLLLDHGLAEASGTGWRATDQAARRYLTGGWLEEYLALATHAVGADEVLLGQRVRWESGGFQGENEIDVIARFGSRLFMCSCKALKSSLRQEDTRTRESLMNALHEADNLADHFAPRGGIVALAVTTDLFDERKRTARYEQLHGKAAALGVNLLTLEHLPWPIMLKRLSALTAVPPE